MNIIWLALGFIGGVIMAQNSDGMQAPYAAAVFVCAFVGVGIAWTAAYHGKRQAVASAVATAVANARAEAHAAAQASVNFYGLSPERAIVPVQSVTDNQIVSNTDTNREIDHDSSVPDLRERRSPLLRPLSRR